MSQKIFLLVSKNLIKKNNQITKIFSKHIKLFVEPAYLLKPEICICIVCNKTYKLCNAIPAFCSFKKSQSRSAVLRLFLLILFDKKKDQLGQDFFGTPFIMKHSLCDMYYVFSTISAVRLFQLYPPLPQLKSGLHLKGLRMIFFMS